MTSVGSTSGRRSTTPEPQQAATAAQELAACARGTGSPPAAPGKARRSNSTGSVGGTGSPGGLNSEDGSINGGSSDSGSLEHRFRHPLPAFTSSGSSQSSGSAAALSAPAGFAGLPKSVPMRELSRSLPSLGGTDEPHATARPSSAPELSAAGVADGPTRAAALVLNPRRATETELDIRAVEMALEHVRGPLKGALASVWHALFTQRPANPIEAAAQDADAPRDVLIGSDAIALEHNRQEATITDQRAKRWSGRLAQDLHKAGFTVTELWNCKSRQDRRKLLANAAVHRHSTIVLLGCDYTPDKNDKERCIIGSLTHPLDKRVAPMITVETSPGKLSYGWGDSAHRPPRRGLHHLPAANYTRQLFGLLRILCASRNLATDMLEEAQEEVRVQLGRALRAMYTTEFQVEREHHEQEVLRARLQAVELELLKTKRELTKATRRATLLSAEKAGLDAIATAAQAENVQLRRDVAEAQDDISILEKQNEDLSLQVGDVATKLMILEGMVKQHAPQLLEKPKGRRRKAKRLNQTAPQASKVTKASKKPGASSPQEAPSVAAASIEAPAGSSLRNERRTPALRAFTLPEQVEDAVVTDAASHTGESESGERSGPVFGSAKP